MTLSGKDLRICISQLFVICVVAIVIGWFLGWCLGGIIWSFVNLFTPVVFKEFWLWSGVIIGVITLAGMLVLWWAAWGEDVDIVDKMYEMFGW